MDSNISLLNAFTNKMVSTINMLRPSEGTCLISEQLIRFVVFFDDDWLKKLVDQAPRSSYSADMSPALPPLVPLTLLPLKIAPLMLLFGCAK